MLALSCESYVFFTMVCFIMPLMYVMYSVVL